VTLTEKTTNYREALRMFLAARTKGDIAKEPRPEDYGLASSQELWFADKVKKEVLG
jgi:hypothetical protein